MQTDTTSHLLVATAYDCNAYGVGQYSGGCSQTQSGTTDASPTNPSTSTSTTNPTTSSTHTVGTVTSNVTPQSTSTSTTPTNTRTTTQQRTSSTPSSAVHTVANMHWGIIIPGAIIVSTIIAGLILLLKRLIRPFGL